jgi:hypothetical protein
MEAPSSGVDFAELLGTQDLYKAKPTLVVTFSNEQDEQSRRFNEITKYYRQLKCSVLKESVMWDYKTGEMSKLSKKESQKLMRSLTHDSLLVITGHGNLQWLFGATPGSEAEAMERFVTWLQALETSAECTLSTIVLDSCMSAAELKEPVEGVSSDSSARILSRLLGGNYKVIGFNGTACTGFVRYQDDGGATKADYGANAVVFIGGQVIKGSTHKETGLGIAHSSAHINIDHEFYGKSFPDGAPELFRTKSFSGASGANPQ